ncbi:NIL domain-containing protein [Nocardia gipuzkoensis]
MSSTKAASTLPSDAAVSVGSMGVSCTREASRSRVFVTPQAAPTRSFVETVLHNRPSADELRRLADRHGGRLVTVEVDDERGIGAALAAAAHAEVRFEVVYGGVSSLQEKTFGSLTLALHGPDDAGDKVVAELERRPAGKKL